MIERQEIEIAMAVMTQGDDYHLQLRGTAPNIGAPGLIGFFGGKIDVVDGIKESAEIAASRELSEETNVILNPSDLRDIGMVTVDMNHCDKPVRIIANVLRAEIGTDISVQAKEGELVTMSLSELRDRSAELTPATKACVEQLL